MKDRLAGAHHRNNRLMLMHLQKRSKEERDPLKRLHLVQRRIDFEERIGVEYSYTPPEGLLDE